MLAGLSFGWASNVAAASPPVCAFVYTSAVRHEIINPFVTRTAGSATGEYDTTHIAAIEEGANVRIQVFRPNSVDGDEIQILLDPCTMKIIYGFVVPNFPITGISR
jgi:hypothetical protein